MLVALGILELKAGNSEAAIDYYPCHFDRRNYAKAYVFMAVAHLHANEIEQALIQLKRLLTLTLIIRYLTWFHLKYMLLN